MRGSRVTIWRHKQSGCSRSGVDVKIRKDYSKPGRAIEKGTVKAQKKYDKPGRAINARSASKE